MKDKEGVNSFQLDCRDYFNQVSHPTAIIGSDLVLLYGNGPFLEMCQLEQVEELPLMEALQRFCVNEVNLRVFREFISPPAARMP